MLRKTILGFLFLMTALQDSPAQIIPSFNINVNTPASSGYYFMDPGRLTVAPAQLILDSLGRTIYYRSISGQGADFKIQPNGLMSFQSGTKFYLWDSTFTVVDSFACRNGILTDDHDFQILPNGHVLLLGIENITMNLSSYLMFGPNHTTPGGTSATVKCGVIQEQDANHNVVFEWHAKDHFAFTDVDTARMGPPNFVDWTHFNAVEMDTDGNILVSIRHFNEITKINRADSSIIWRLGGNANQFSFLNDPAKFIGQHDIRRIANGNITMWDNGRAAPPFHAGTAKEYLLDENLLTATLVWTYVESPTAFSTATGNVQRLANGNTLVNFGLTPMEARLFDVVDVSGNKVFEIQFVDTLRSYSVFNYQTLPWQMPRPQITCITIGNQGFLDAGSGHSSYRWSTGATTQTIPITIADTFSVWVPIGIGGYIRSEFFIVTDTSNPCLSNGIAFSNSETNFSIYPNPAKDHIIIHSQIGKNEIVHITIFDFTGREIYSERTVPSQNGIVISVADFPKGIYMVRVNDWGGKFIKI